MSRPLHLTLSEIFVLFSRVVGRPVRGDHRLPIIWLSGQEQGGKVLNALFDRLRNPARYLVPYARVSDTSEEPARDIRPLLRAVCLKLAAPSFGGERLRFRYYELVVWLMGLNLSQLEDEERSRRIVTLLRERHRPFQNEENSRNDNAVDVDFGLQYRLVVWLIRQVLPKVFFRVAISGKIPGLGRRYRWFMSQQYLAPPQSVNFLGFAERLTEGVREPEDADQIDRLLVHAFLEDLRRAYRRSGRIEGWRRTAYPVVLIDNVTKDSPGHRLLQLINDVRNETGESDPLLVVCSSDEVPPAPTQATHPRGVEFDVGTRGNGDPVYQDSVYRDWVDALPGSRRARVDTAWYLPIVVHDSDSAKLACLRLVARRPPRWARRSVVAAAVSLLVVTGAAGVDWRYGGGGWDCRHVPFRGQVNVVSMGGECIGYSGSGQFRFTDVPGQEALLHIQDVIFAQNAAVGKLWEGNRSRPYATLVYLGIFTGRPVGPNEEAYAAEREELEGLALAQYDSLSDEPATSQVPLLKIVIANGGQRMRYASVAADMIGHLAAADPTVVSVIGLDESRDSTANALKKLNEIGLPVIATTLSADHMDNNSQFYLQLGAPNNETARTIAAYSSQVLKAFKAQVYWTTGGSIFKEDLYVRTLVDDLNRVLPEFKITIDYSGPFVNGLLHGDVCDYPGVVIFAGRWDDFPDFLDAFNGCPDDRSMHVIADDSISRYTENPALRKTAPATLPLVYVSKTIPITCEYLHAVHDNSAATFLRLIQETGFLQSFQADGSLRSQRCEQNNQNTGAIGERVPAAYDAAILVRQAVEDLSDEPRPDSSSQEWNPRSIVPAVVYLRILQRIRQKQFSGVTGEISFTDSADDVGEPVGRVISLLRIDNIPQSTVHSVEVFQCSWNRVNATASVCPEPVS